MLTNIGIIGEGKMGTNILYYLLDMDFRLTWICNPEAEAEKIRRTFRRKLERSLDAGIFTEEAFQSILDRVTISRDLQCISSCDLIIEAISEDTEAKQSIFRQMDLIAPPGCIFTSNSSSILPSKMVPSDARKESFAGLHFFYPVALKDIAEIIITAETSGHTIQELQDFLYQIRRQSLVLKEKDSFILNRIYLGFQNDAYLLVHDGKATIQQVDRIVRDHFFPIGVFEFFDSVGLDVMLASVKNYTMEATDQDRFQPLIRKLESLVSAGKLGLKSKEGFYPAGAASDTIPSENDNEIARNLSTSYSGAFRHFSRSSGIPPSLLKTAMDEYFGADTPLPD